MGTKKNIAPQWKHSQQATDKEEAIAQKFEELIELLRETKLDSEQVLEYKARFDEALGTGASVQERLKVYEQLDDEEMSRADRLDELARLLNTNPVDNKTVREYRRSNWTAKIAALSIGITLIALGFAMIILPAPADFEIYTLFYLNANDGVTIMDVISLLIIFTGIFIIVTTMKKKES